jgi:thioredoxin 1
VAIFPLSHIRFTSIPTGKSLWKTTVYQVQPIGKQKFLLPHGATSQLLRIFRPYALAPIIVHTVIWLSKVIKVKFLVLGPIQARSQRTVFPQITEDKNMSWNREFNQSKTLFSFGGAVLIFLLIAYLIAFRGTPSHTEHSLPQMHANDFESIVLKAETPVLVDFYADWCVPCRQMEPILTEFAHENSNVKVVQVNVDENHELADRYHVRSIPNLLVFKNGEITAQQSGAIDKNALKGLIEQ